MSGLKNEPVQGGKYLNFKDGKIISAVSGQKEAYTHVEGLLTELDIVDENYKGKDYRKVILFITDDENNVWKLGFPLESGYGNAFCSMALNIDYSKPVEISGGIKELNNDRSFGVMYIKQEGKNLKWYYTKDSEEVPKGVKSKDRSGEFYDFTERNAFFHRLLIETVRPAILEATLQEEKPKKETKKPSGKK